MYLIPGVKGSLVLPPPKKPFCQHDYVHPEAKHLVTIRYLCHVSCINSPRR